jgi:FAD:protein FMN transferase
MKVFHHSCFAMGTRFNLIIPGLEKEQGKILAKKADLILNEQELIMSCHHEDSEVLKINHLAYQQKVKLSAELFDILKTCDYYYKKTLGAFDPALLGITSTVKSEPGTGKLPVDLQPMAFGWEHVLWDTDSATLQFTGENIGLDLGGFGKGWALDKIIGYLKSEGVESAFISFGESTISVIGEHPLGGPWQTSVPDIHKYNAPLDLNLINESFSISGLKEKSGITEKERFPHIFSSDKGGMVGEDNSILVKSKSVVEAEILSTALFAANHGSKTHILDTFDDIEVFECGNDGWIRK